VKLSAALVEAGLFVSQARVIRWIEEGKIFLNGEKIKKDCELEGKRDYAIELCGNKLNGKFILDAPTSIHGSYTSRGPIR